MQNTLPLPLLETLLSRHEKRYTKLLDIHTEYLQQYSVQQYSIMRAYLENKIEKYKSEIDMIKAKSITVNSPEEL